jgi:hypothetical protein
MDVPSFLPGCQFLLAILPSTQQPIHEPPPQAPPVIPDLYWLGSVTVLLIACLLYRHLLYLTSSSTTWATPSLTKALTAPLIYPSTTAYCCTPESHLVQHHVCHPVKQGLRQQASQQDAGGAEQEAGAGRGTGVKAHRVTDGVSHLHAGHTCMCLSHACREENSNLFDVLGSLQ